MEIDSKSYLPLSKSYNYIAPQSRWNQFTIAKKPWRFEGDDGLGGLNVNFTAFIDQFDEMHVNYEIVKLLVGSCIQDGSPESVLHESAVVAIGELASAVRRAGSEAGVCHL